MKRKSLEPMSALWANSSRVEVQSSEFKVPGSGFKAPLLQNLKPGTWNLELTYPLIDLTSAVASEASFSIAVQSPFASASFGTIHVPPQQMISGTAK